MRGRWRCLRGRTRYWISGGCAAASRCASTVSLVGEAFCAPYRFELRGTAGRTVRLEVTVHNTLAPYLAEATPTAWAFPSQLPSGLLGPVTLERRV